MCNWNSPFTTNTTASNFSAVCFQIEGVDVMDLLTTERGNQHVIVFQDFLTKWPLIFPVPDQKSLHLVRLFAEELVPMFGIPETLLSDRESNLLSYIL